MKWTLEPGIFCTPGDCSTVDGLILTLAGPSPQAPVLARRLKLTVREGSGQLMLPDAPSTDADWQQSVHAAWAAACALTKNTTQDGLLAVASKAPLSGISAGLSVGLLALQALLDRPAPQPYFATGGVMPQASNGEHPGWLEGGSATLHKARAAADYAPQLEMPGALFLSPPILEPLPEVGIPIHFATDLASAYSVIDPRGYALIHEQHHAMMTRDRPAGTTNGPCAIIEQAPKSSIQWPAKYAGIQVLASTGSPEGEIPPGMARVRLFDQEGALWTWIMPDVPEAIVALPRCLELAKQAKARRQPTPA